MIQGSNHQSKPAIWGKLRRVRKKGPSSQGPRSRPWWVCQEQSKSYRARAGKTFFATQAPTYFIISYVSKNAYSSHAKSMLPFSKHRSRDALRAGLVAIRSRQRVSERRSPEQGENRSAGCWPQKIHPHTQLLQAQAKTRSTRKNPGCKQSRTDFAQSIGKNTTGRNIRPRLTASRVAKLLEDGSRFQPKLLRTGRYMPQLFICKTQRLRSKPDHFSEISRIFR